MPTLGSEPTPIHPGWLSLLEDWQQDQALRRLSEHTRSAYLRQAQILLEQGHIRSAPPIEVSTADLRRLLAERHGLGLSPRTLAQTLAAWRSLFEQALKRGLVHRNPVQGLKAPRADRLLPKALGPDAVRDLLDRQPPDPIAHAALRDRAMFELFYSSGLRLSELVGLDLHSGGQGGFLDCAAGEVEVLGKGGRRRRVPVGSQALAAIEAWLQVRDQWLKPATPPADRVALFLGERGARIHPRQVQQRLSRWARACGLPVAVHPHALRHSFASHLLQSSQDLRGVQELLGHQSIAATQVYTRLDFQHLAQVYDAAHPRARRRPTPPSNA